MGKLVFGLVLLGRPSVVLVRNDLPLGCHRLPPVFNLETKTSADGDGKEGYPYAPNPYWDASVEPSMKVAHRILSLCSLVRKRPYPE